MGDGVTGDGMGQNAREPEDEFQPAAFTQWREKTLSCRIHKVCDTTGFLRES